MKKQDIQALFDVSGKVALITGATGGFGQGRCKGARRSRSKSDGNGTHIVSTRTARQGDS